MRDNDDAPRQCQRQSLAAGNIKLPIASSIALFRADFDYGDNFDRRSERKGGSANGSAGVAAFVAEYFGKEVRGSVYGGYTVRKITRRRKYEALQLHNTFNPVKRAEFALCNGQQIENTLFRRCLGLVGCAVDADRTLGDERSIGHWNLPRDIEHVARENGGHIAADGLGRLWQNDSKFSKALVYHKSVTTPLVP
jgi:hypothetical protein